MLCNYLQNVAAITYIFVLQLSTFLFYNKHFAGKARMIDKYGAEVLRELEEKKQNKEEKEAAVS